MTSIETLSRFPPVETERKPSIGTILAIVGIDPNRNGENASDPLLWTTIERKPKLATDRIQGQISFPADTRKVGEGVMGNVVGSLAEFSNNERLIREALSLMPSSLAERRVFVRGNPADLIVIIFDQSLTHPIVPFDVDEVDGNGWMSIRQLRGEDPSHLRSFVRDIVKMEEDDGLINRVVTDFFRSQQARIPFSTVLPSDFSMASFHGQREKLVDVVR